MLWPSGVDANTSITDCAQANANPALWNAARTTPFFLLRQINRRSCAVMEVLPVMLAIAAALEEWLNGKLAVTHVSSSFSSWAVMASPSRFLLMRPHDLRQHHEVLSFVLTSTALSHPRTMDHQRLQTSTATIKIHMIARLSMLYFPVLVSWLHRLADGGVNGSVQRIAIYRSQPIVIVCAGHHCIAGQLSVM